jgi:hypothetical protein
MKIVFVGNQGGREVYSFYLGMARALGNEFDMSARFSVWLERERREIVDQLGINSECVSFERYVYNVSPAGDEEVDRLTRDYREVNWSEVVAAERAFTDYSMLLGAAGDRRESAAYVRGLVVAVARFLEQSIAGCDAMVCQTADTLFSLVAFKVARHFGVPAFAISPAWLLEPGRGAGFFANSEFLECKKMAASYLARSRSEEPLSPCENKRVEALIRSIRSFDGKTAFNSSTSKGRQAGRTALSPNKSRLIAYILTNAKRDKKVDYLKIDPIRKLQANMLRLARKRMARNSFGPVDVEAVPARSVFYAMHYQPEQSTLAQGIWYVNQVALVENISKSLPLGYTLVVKEHPWGRGNRPRWQYEHLAGFYNVRFCDAPAKEIIKRVDAVVTVSGTVAMEALVFDKPVALLGRNFFEFCDLLYKVPAINDLPEVLAKILLDNDYAKQTDREERLHRFLIAYLDGLVPYFPLQEFASDWGRALAAELKLKPVEDLIEENKRTA